MSSIKEAKGVEIRKELNEVCDIYGYEQPTDQEYDKFLVSLRRMYGVMQVYEIRNAFDKFHSGEYKIPRQRTKAMDFVIITAVLGEHNRQRQARQADPGMKHERLEQLERQRWEMMKEKRRDFLRTLPDARGTEWDKLRSKIRMDEQFSYFEIVQGHDIGVGAVDFMKWWNSTFEFDTTNVNREEIRSHLQKYVGRTTF